jgi:hypothetical protein
VETFKKRKQAYAPIKKEGDILLPLNDPATIEWF